METMEVGDKWTSKWMETRGGSERMEGEETRGTRGAREKNEERRECWEKRVRG